MLSCVRSIVFEQCFKFTSGYFFFFKKELRTCVQYRMVLLYDRLRLRVAFINDALHFLVDRAGNFLAVSSRCMTEITANENFIAVVVIIDQAETFGHTELGDHGFGDRCRLPDILGRPCRNVVEDLFLSDTSAQRYRDLLEHMSL